MISKLFVIFGALLASFTSVSGTSSSFSHEVIAKTFTDPPDLYQTYSSQFASGFFEGTKVIKFMSNDLYVCMGNLTESLKYFETANSDFS